MVIDPLYFKLIDRIDLYNLLFGKVLSNYSQLKLDLSIYIIENYELGSDMIVKFSETIHSSFLCQHQKMSFELYRRICEAGEGYHSSDTETYILFQGRVVEGREKW